MALTFMYALPLTSLYHADSDSMNRWKDLNKMGAVAGSVGGMAIALVVWLAAAKATGGAITVDTLSDQWVSFAGNVAAIVSGGVLSVGLSLWKPANFDWEKTRQMEVVRDENENEAETGQVDGSGRSSGADSDDKKEADDEKYVVDAPQPDLEASAPADGLDLGALQQTYKFYGWIFAALALIITIVSPLYLSLSPFLHEA